MKRAKSTSSSRQLALQQILHDSQNTSKQLEYWKISLNQRERIYKKEWIERMVNEFGLTREEATQRLNDIWSGKRASTLSNRKKSFSYRYLVFSQKCITTIRGWIARLIQSQIDLKN